MAPRSSKRTEIVQSKRTSSENAKLREIARKGNKISRGNLFTTHSILTNLRILLFIFLTALSFKLSQLALAPVYGSIPSALFHERMKLLFLLPVPFLAGRSPSRKMPENFKYWLPVVAFWIPTMQFFAYGQSALLGAYWGPALTELLTIYPLLFVTMISVNHETRYFNLSSQSNAFLEYGIMIGYFGTALLTTRYLDSAISFLVHRGLGRVFLQLAVASIYAVAAPSKLLLLVVPSILFSLSYNVHIIMPSTTATLNATLQGMDFTLVDRAESSTGYISVLDNTKENYRVLRCDHSILGGEWLAPPHGFEHTSNIREPVYAVFVMLEAVRLVKVNLPPFLEHLKLPGDEDAERQKRALIIGVGVGTSATALIHHNVDTTTVEIDPIVHSYATKYFNLPSNHTSIIQDAVTFTSAAQLPESKHYESYDYVIHDVFTGGAEPIALFTHEFLRGLSALLRINGVIAINYAGDLTLPSTRLIYRTVRSVFPFCRIFREDAPKSPSGSSPEQDFTNLVFFCTRSPSPFSFRRPVESDFLGSYARRNYLLPLFEVKEEDLLDIEETGEGKHKIKDEKVLLKDSGGLEILEIADGGKGIRWLEKEQRRSAVGHWRIMRGVMPPRVWELW